MSLFLPLLSTVKTHSSVLNGSVSLRNLLGEGWALKVNAQGYPLSSFLPGLKGSKQQTACLFQPNASLSLLLLSAFAGTMKAVHTHSLWPLRY